MSHNNITISPEKFFEELSKRDNEISKRDKAIGELSTKLLQYEGVTSAVFAREILENFRKKHLNSYTVDSTADNIEEAYVRFLTDPNNEDGVKVANILQDRRLTPAAFAKNCETAYAKLCKVARAALNSYRILHSDEMLMGMLLQVPLLDGNEKLLIEVLSTFV